MANRHTTRAQASLPPLPAGRAPTEWAQTLLWFGFGLSALCCCLWLCAPTSWAPWLTRWIRPHAAAGSLACSVALGCRLYPARGRLAPWMASLAATLAAGDGLLACWGHWGGSAPTWARHLLSGDELSPLSACLLVVLAACCLAYAGFPVEPTVSSPGERLASSGEASAADHVAGSVARSAARQRPLHRLADAGSLAVLCLSLGFSLATVLALAVGGLPTSSLMMPGTALLYACLSLALYVMAPGRLQPQQRGRRRAAADALLGQTLARQLLLAAAALAAVHLVCRGLPPAAARERLPLEASAAVAILAWLCAGLRRALRAHTAAPRRRLRRLRARLRILATKQRRIHAIWRAVTPHAVVATDEQGRITNFNAGAERLLGLRAEEVVGVRNITELYAPSELARRAAAMGVTPGFDVVRAVPKLGKWDERACRWQNHAGAELAVQVTACAYAATGGAGTGYAFWARPISGAEHAQRDRDGYLHVSQELLIKTDRDNRILEASHAFKRVLGWRPEDLVGRYVHDFVHPDDARATRGVLALIHGGKWVEHFENRWRAKTGAWRTISWDAATPLGDLVSYGGGLDVTDEKRRAREREQHLAFERKIIGIVSHDLRNPITAISMAEQLIRRDPTDRAAVVRNLERIQQSVVHAERLLHDLLDFSRARIGGGLRVRRQTTCLAQLLRRAVQAAQSLRPAPRVVVDAPPALRAAVDPQRLQQVVDNLLCNAMVHGDCRAPVTVRLWAQGGHDVALSVHNLGPSIPIEDLPRLFEPFWQAKAQAQGEQHSVGLGLYIVQQVIEAHGGRVDVRSDEAQGTQFTVHLPATR